MATFLCLQTRPLSSRVVNGSRSAKYEIILLSVSVYILKYLMKSLGAIVGMTTLKKFSIFVIPFYSNKEIYNNLYFLEWHFSKVGHIEDFPMEMFGNPTGALIDFLLKNVSILKMSHIVKFNYVLLYLFPCWLH